MRDSEVSFLGTSHRCDLPRCKVYSLGYRLVRSKVRPGTSVRERHPWSRRRYLSIRGIRVRDPVVEMTIPPDLGRHQGLSEMGHVRTRQYEPKSLLSVLRHGTYDNGFTSVPHGSSTRGQGVQSLDIREAHTGTKSGIGVPVRYLWWVLYGHGVGDVRSDIRYGSRLFLKKWVLKRPTSISITLLETVVSWSLGRVVTSIGVVICDFYGYQKQLYLESNVSVCLLCFDRDNDQDLSDTGLFVRWNVRNFRKVLLGSGISEVLH